MRSSFLSVKKKKVFCVTMIILRNNTLQAQDLFEIETVSTKPMHVLR